MKTFALAALAGAASAATSDHWAVIMAGSNTYSNYRHQADSHHAVKIMLENGIPRDQIIHLAYNDIANNYRNPFKGQLFNKPIYADVSEAEVDAANVYDEDHIDYTGTAVNKSNFFKVLLGDDSAAGPVLKSNSESRVFVYFVDHGGAGLICTPNSSSDWIYADELDSTLKQMKANGMFKELVFYLETCESGSMFPNITADDNIYAMTASNATLSSWGAYCGSEAVVDATNVGSCLGDLFSINWMEDTEANDPSVETLATQHTTVTEKTTRSPVQIFGDESFMSEPIGDFQGTTEMSQMSFKDKVTHHAHHIYKKATAEDSPSRDLVDSRDIELHYLYQQVIKTGSSEDMENLQKHLDHREHIDSLFAQFDDIPNADPFVQDYDCLRMMVGGVEEMCGPWSSYSLKYVRKLADACNALPADDISKMYVSIGEFCNAI